MEQGYRDKNGVLLESGDRVEWLGNPLDRSSPYIEGVGPGALPRGYIEGVVLSVGQHLELQDSDDERYQYSYLHPSMITKVAHAYDANCYEIYRGGLVRFNEQRHFRNYFLEGIVLYVSSCDDGLIDLWMEMTDCDIWGDERALVGDIWALEGKRCICFNVLSEENGMQHMKKRRRGVWSGETT